MAARKSGGRKAGMLRAMLNVSRFYGIGVLLTVLGLVACSSPAPNAPAAREPGAVRVMSFNIRYGTASDGDHAWPKRRDLVLGLVNEKPYDIIGVQEALRFQIDEILASNPDLASIGVGRDDGKEKGEHSSILYRKSRLTPDAANQGTVWLSDTPGVAGSKHWGNGITRVFTFARFTYEGGAFWVYNTHFDHQSEPSRQRSAEAIAAHMARHTGRERVLVTGDFNCDERSRAIRYLKGEVAVAWENAMNTTTPPSPKLVDTFRVLYPDERAVSTFQGFGAKVEPGVGVGAWGEKIDYVFMGAGDRGWPRVLEAAIDTRTFGPGPTKYPSDHWAVTATLSE